MTDLLRIDKLYYLCKFFTLESLGPTHYLLQLEFERNTQKCLSGSLPMFRMTWAIVK